MIRGPPGITLMTDKRRVPSPVPCMTPTTGQGGWTVGDVGEHLAWLTFRGSSQRTVQAREVVLRKAEQYRPLATWQAEDVLRWVGRPHLAAESRRTYLSHLRGYYRWAVEQGRLPADPTAGVPSVKVPRRVPRPVPIGELNHAIALAPPRMAAWLRLAALAGLRCMEIAALEPRDVVDSEVGPVLLLRVTKGGHEATVPLHPQVAESLARLPIHAGVWWRLTPGTVSTDIATYLRSVGVNATAHQLRHASATLWYEASGADLLTVQRLLRHRSVSSTQIYADVHPLRPAEVVRLVRGVA